ncbi:methyl-accepting chemotaxis protein [Cohnella zeiphila]|nr:methyl-accepting chemotaxis protein [Cohnella zeiphila]
MSIQLRLRLLFFVPLILFVATAVYLLSQNSSNVNGLSKSLYEVSYKASTQILSASRDMYQANNDYGLLRLADLPKDVHDKLAADFNVRLRQIGDKIASASDIMQKNGLNGLADPDSKKSVKDLLDGFQTSFEAWSKQAAANLQEAPAHDSAKEAELAQVYDSGSANIDAIGGVLDRYAQTQTADAKKKSHTTAVSVYTSVIIEWIIILLVGVMFLFSLNRSLKQAINKTKTVAGGNLQYIPQSRYRKDELGQLNQSLDTMIEKIRSLVRNISDNTHTVSASAVELSVSAKESAEASTHVAGNIQEVTTQMEQQAVIADETSRAVEEMATGVQRIAENTGSISDLSASASGQVEQGNVRVQHLRRQFEDILGSIQALSGIVAKLTEKSEKIGQITEDITSFANQTNILSLNASIEAARAGEHGKGFAVVAHEIRNLAAGSIESAETISGLIAETRDEIERVSNYMETTLTQSRAGQEHMVGVEETFASILQAVKQVAEQVHETSAITEQMSASSEEVSASMDQASGTARDVAGKAQSVAAATEEQSALVENISHASEQLQSIVRNLKESVSQFRL